jgi:hypothetical protein
MSLPHADGKLDPIPSRIFIRNHEFDYLRKTGIVMTALFLFTVQGFVVSKGSAGGQFLKSVPATNSVASEPEAIEVSPAIRASITERYGKLPLSLEIDRGQANPAVKFLARGNRHTLFLTLTEPSFASVAHPSVLKDHLLHDTMSSSTKPVDPMRRFYG